MNMIWFKNEWAECHERLSSDRSDEPLCYDINLRIAVADGAALWRAAAEQMLMQTSGEISRQEIEDVLGPMDDPAVSDCLALVIGPRPVAGCIFEDFDIAQDRSE